MANLGIDFTVIKPGDDVEPAMSDYRNLTQAALSVEDSARIKASYVARNLDAKEGPCLVIGADTVVRYGRHSLGKPHSAEEALSMLRSLSDRWHYVLSGVCVCREGGQACHCAHAITKVKFRAITAAEMAAYVATGLPMDKAGAYGIQDFGSLFLERLEGCYFNVMGLPVSVLDSLLKKFGYHIFGRE